MGKGAKREHEDEVVKVPFKQWFPEWFHHKSTGPDDPDRYMGTRTADKWRSILLFYAIFYVFMICFWIINYEGMLASLPDRIGGDGPVYTRLQRQGYTQVTQNSGSFGSISASSSTYTGSGDAFNSFRSQLSQSDYQALQSTLTTNLPNGQSGSKFLYDNCTTGDDGCNTSLGPYGTFGPVFLITYRNREWNKPQGACAISCTYMAAFIDATTATGTISANHFWKLDFQTGVWTRGHQSLDCTPFKNQHSPDYRALTAVSSEGLATKQPSSYTITCTVGDMDNDGTSSTTLNFVA